MGGIRKVLYRATASAEGGREGKVRTADGRLAVDLAVPAELGGDGGDGTNPEQLFAAGYAACFQSALLTVATAYGVDVTGSQVVVEVGMGPTGQGGMGLVVGIDLSAPGLDPAQAGRLVRRAHQFCPYSRAVHGNVEVTLKANGSPLAAH